ncbi:MAG: hypothetical protein AAFR97_08810, partial [Bacteroidota bacterium]
MAKYMLKQLLIILLCVSGLPALAQQPETLDKIFLNFGGSRLGQITQWNDDGSIIYTDTSGQVYELSDQDYRRVGYLRLSPETSPTPKHSLSASQGTKGFVRMSMGFNFGRNPEPEFFDSFFPNNRYSTGYQFGVQYGREIGESVQLMAGLHYASYRYERGERTFGPSLTARWRFNSSLQKIGLFAQAETAYEWPIGNNRQGITDREGGFAIHPSVGLVFSQAGDVLSRLSIDVGYRFLKTAYRVNQFGTDEFRSPEYRRLVMRISYRL